MACDAQRSSWSGQAARDQTHPSRPPLDRPTFEEGGEGAGEAHEAGDDSRLPPSPHSCHIAGNQVEPGPLIGQRDRKPHEHRSVVISELTAEWTLRQRHRQQRSDRSWRSPARPLVTVDGSGHRGQKHVSKVMAAGPRDRFDDLQRNRGGPGDTLVTAEGPAQGTGDIARQGQEAKQPGKLPEKASYSTAGRRGARGLRLVGVARPIRELAEQRNQRSPIGDAVMDSHQNRRPSVSERQQLQDPRGSIAWKGRAYSLADETRQRRDVEG